MPGGADGSATRNNKEGRDIGEAKACHIQTIRRLTRGGRDCTSFSSNSIINIELNAQHRTVLPSNYHRILGTSLLEHDLSRLVQSTKATISQTTLDNWQQVDSGRPAATSRLFQSNTRRAVSVPPPPAPCPLPPPPTPHQALSGQGST